MIVNDDCRNDLPIIGRERALIDALTTALNASVGGPEPSRKDREQLRRHNVSAIWQTRRGNAFEVQIVGPERDVTGHIVRVTIEVDRFESPTTGRQ